MNPVQGDPILNDPTQPLAFNEHTEIELSDVTFKGVMGLALHFPACKKLKVVGNVQTTLAILRVIDPANLKSLQHFNITVYNAEEEAVENGEKSSHLLYVLYFIEQIASTDLQTVRINFNKIHLSNILTAFSPTKLLSDLTEDEHATQYIVFNKVSRLVTISAKTMVLSMQFLDDLDLTSSAFLTKHYVVSHTTRSDNLPSPSYMQYLIKKRVCREKGDKNWSVSLLISD